VVPRTIRGGDEGVFVPTLAVLAGLMLAFVGIAVLRMEQGVGDFVVAGTPLVSLLDPGDLDDATSAPSKARRFLSGASPGRARVSHPPVSRVAPLADSAVMVGRLSQA